MGYFAETVLEDLGASAELHMSLFSRGMWQVSCNRVNPGKAVNRPRSDLFFHRAETRIYDRWLTRGEPGSKQFRPKGSQPDSAMEAAR